MLFRLDISDYNHLRAYLIESGFYDLYSAYRRYLWQYRLLTCGLIDEIPSDIAPYESIYVILSKYGIYSNICQKMYESRRAKSKRIRKRLDLMFKYSKNKHFLFLTFKFSDDTLFNTSQDTRRQYVRRYLKSYADSYVANIDYGLKNGREHFHAVVDCEFVDLKFWDKYGNLDYEKIPHLRQDSLKLAKYINKLTNHSVKNGTQFAIYSRNLKDYEKLEDEQNSLLFDIPLIDDDDDFPF